VVALHNGLMRQVEALQSGACDAHEYHEHRQRAAQGPPRSSLLPSHDPFSLSAPSGACQTTVLTPAPGMTRATATPAPGSRLRLREAFSEGRLMHIFLLRAGGLRY
jgi:hypothetical protein